MTQQRLTQCPHCKASFKVSEEQLNAANGRVRCGACMNIFDAIAYSLSDSQELQKPKDSYSSNPNNAVDLEEELLNDGPREDEQLFADNPEEDEKESGYSGSKKLDDELSTSFLELEEDDTSDPYTTSFKKIEDDFISEDAVDESWTQDILEDLNTSESKEGKVFQNIKREPSISGLDIEPEFSSPNDLPNDDFAKFETQNQSEKSQSYEKIHFEYQQDSDSSQRHWFISFLFIIANILLLVTLLAQASWYHYEKLARYPQIAKLYALTCEHLSCTLPKLEDITKIKSQNLVVRSHPTARKALIIDTVIINEAAFPQDFPDVALYFSDINKKTIAQRLVTKNEYLNGELIHWDKMPSNQPIHISLEIIDPGKEAVNYHLEFFPSNPETHK